MPPPYYPPGPRPLSFQSPAAVVGIVLVVVVGAFMAIAVMTTATGFMGFTGFIFLPVCGIMVVVLIVILLAVTQGFTQQRIPPPPPIQQPMVPAGQTGPIALNCPNCGAPPQNVDRFGVATCTYCNTRFLVR
jgi:hypothetical protein